MINLGSTEISKAYLGSTAVDKIYLGSTQIWSNIVTAPGRMQLASNYVANGSWSKVVNMVASSTYGSTTTIVENCLVVPGTGNYTLSGGAIFGGGLGTQISRAVLQNGTVLSEDSGGSNPSVIPTVVVSLNGGDQIRLEAIGSVAANPYNLVSANVNTFIQIVPV